jgi:hypothetical protein
MNKEVEITISPEDAKGLVFGGDVRVTVMGKVKSIREEAVIEVTSDKEEKAEREKQVCVRIEPQTIKIGGKEIDGGNSKQDKFYKEYNDYLGLKKSMESRGKKARMNGDTIVGE